MEIVVKEGLGWSRSRFESWVFIVTAEVSDVVKCFRQQAENNFFTGSGRRVVKEEVKRFIVKETGSFRVFEKRFVEG